MCCSLSANCVALAKSAACAACSTQAQLLCQNDVAATSQPFPSYAVSLAGTTLQVRQCIGLVSSGFDVPTKTRLAAASLSPVYLRHNYCPVVAGSCYHETLAASSRNSCSPAGICPCLSRDCCEGTPCRNPFCWRSHCS